MSEFLNDNDDAKARAIPCFSLKTAELKISCSYYITCTNGGAIIVFCPTYHCSAAGYQTNNFLAITNNLRPPLSWDKSKSLSSNKG